MKTVGVAILGLGVVGSGTYKILTEHREFYRRTQDIDVNVECVLEINRERALALGIEPQKICGNIAEIGNAAVQPIMLQYASIVVAMVPILCIYPFLQKYFEKGIMMGAVKG